MASQPSLQTIAMRILLNISQSKGNQTMKLGQLIQYNKRHIFIQKLQYEVRTSGLQVSFNIFR